MADNQTQSNETKTWPDLAESLYSKLTGRGAQITYEFVNFELFVPSKVGQGAEHAHWKMNGVLNIRTTDHADRKNENLNQNR